MPSRPPHALALVAACVVSGCGFTAGFDNTHYKCGEGDRCPTGYMCVAGYCETSNPGGDGSVPDANNSSPDANQVTPAGCGKLELLQDDFADGVVASYPWDLISDTNISVAETGGDLAVTIAGGSGDYWGGVKALPSYDFTDSEIETRVDAIGGFDTVLEVRSYYDEKAQMVVEGGQLIAGVFNTGSSGTRTMMTYDPNAMRYWRLRESAGRMYWEYSADRSHWMHLWDEPDPFAVTDVRGVVAAGGQLAAASTARFGDVNGQATGGVYCATDSLHDSFDGGAFDPTWGYWSDVGCSIAETGGDLVMTFDGAEANCFSGINSNHLFDLRGSQWVVDAKQVPVLAHFITYIGVQDPRDPTQNHALEAGLDYGTGTGTPVMYFQETNNGNTQLAYAEANYDAASMRYLRFREASNRLYIDTSPDNATWTNRLDAAEQIDMSEVQLVIGAGNYMNTAATTAKFGGVNP